MITTRRSEGNIINAYESETSKGGVALLERKEVATVAPVEDAEARARMQDNLEKLLNYDRYSEIQDSVATIEAPVQEVEQVVEMVNLEQQRAFADEDIRPTSTTMQFGDGDIEKLRMDMRKVEEQKGSYRLNGKGKLVVVLYSLVVTVILALIAVNSGVLASLSNTTQAKAVEYQSKVATYNALQSEIESITSSEHIINVATGEYGMIKG